MVADALDEERELVVEHVDLAEGLELGLLRGGLRVGEEVCAEGVGGREGYVVDCRFAGGGCGGGVAIGVVVGVCW